MAIFQGRKGKITVESTVARQTVAELGSWSIGGQTRNMIDVSAFGDDVMRHTPGMIDPGTITFQGFWDGTDSTGQVVLQEALTSGVPITRKGGGSTATIGIYNLRLWASTSTGGGSAKGFWTCTGSSKCELYVTGMDLGQDKNGVATVTFNAKVTGALLTWSSST